MEYLMVPIHLDALVLHTEEQVAFGMTDFRRLPFFNGRRHVNSDVANLSEEIVSEALQDRNLTLKPGIHLHWSLPDGLTKGRQDQVGGGIVFPAVPNRWLVTLTKGDRIQQQWVVESDYLYPVGGGASEHAIAYPNPYFSKDNPEQQQRFRYMGRRYMGSLWRERNPESTHSSYLPADRPLTALGYGEHNFAALYANCHSIWGLHDSATHQMLASDLTYDVVGWYSDPAQDALQKFVTQYRVDFSAHHSGELPAPEQILQAVEQRFGWTLTLGEGSEFPERLACYSRLSFKSSEVAEHPDRAKPLKVSVGHTATEALSAYLARMIEPEQKSLVEDQLEAFHLGQRLHGQRLDLGVKFRQARHEKTFSPSPGGTLWTVRCERMDTFAANAAGPQALPLPDAIAGLLHTVNARQHIYDRASAHLDSLREQLFYDWYKFMLSVYPPQSTPEDALIDSNEIKDFMEQESVPELKKQALRAGTLSLSKAEDGYLVAAKAQGELGFSYAADVADALNRLLAALATHNGQERQRGSGAHYVVRPIAGPRYWRPNEPVVMLIGDAAGQSPRHGRDGRLHAEGYLTCGALHLGGSPTPGSYRVTLRGFIDATSQSGPQSQVGFQDWLTQPWHPFLLEWVVESFPLLQAGNHRYPELVYQGDFITSQFDLVENAVDLTPSEGQRAHRKTSSVFRGRSILTPDAHPQLRRQLQAYLDDRLLGQFFEDQKIPAARQNETYLDDPERLDRVRRWFEEQHAGDVDTLAGSVVDPRYTALRALDEMSDLKLLAQRLGGFNEALLMRRQTQQLPIDDPIGFSDLQPFSEQVAELVAGHTRRAARPLSSFQPIRSGAVYLRRLRLVDTFGRSRHLEGFRLAGHPETADHTAGVMLNLPPRLVQPARLNFRWLASRPGAGDVSLGDIEMNAHTATSPICGWLIANHLDNSLMFYEPSGSVLGAIVRTTDGGQWRSAPGERRRAIEQIPNATLRAVAVEMLTQSRLDDPEGGETSFLDQFIVALDRALENIDPEGFAQHEGVALLMGRPIAVVRTSVELQLQGLPAINQDWDVFLSDIERGARHTDGVSDIAFPIRLGDYGRLNDGLLGYWLESSEGFVEHTFYAPQTDSRRITDSRIQTHRASRPLNIFRSLSDPAQKLTMLLDPRASVHATCGILPTKELSIPPDQYVDALKAIEVTFLNPPVLTDQDKLRLPLPAEPGYAWSFLEKDSGVWMDTPTTEIEPTDPKAGFRGPPVLREGWLKLKTEPGDST